MNSTNFAFWGFSEVRRHGVLRHSAIIQNQGIGIGPSQLRSFLPLLRLGVYF
jgi:hypothetical protein